MAAVNDEIDFYFTDTEPQHRLTDEEAAVTLQSWARCINARKTLFRLIDEERRRSEAHARAVRTERLITYEDSSTEVMTDYYAARRARTFASRVLVMSVCVVATVAACSDPQKPSRASTNFNQRTPMRMPTRYR